MMLYEYWEKTELMIYSTIGGNCVSSVLFSVSTRQILTLFLPEEYKDINNSEDRQKRGNSSKHTAVFCFNVDC